jgi:hypothetical protein
MMSWLIQTLGAWINLCDNCGTECACLWYVYSLSSPGLVLLLTLISFILIWRTYPMSLCPRPTSTHAPLNQTDNVHVQEAGLEF